MKLDLERPWVETVDARGAGPKCLGGRFEVGDIKDAAGPVQPAVGADDHRVGRVVRVGAGHALQHANFEIGLVVAVGVFEEPDLRRQRLPAHRRPRIQTPVMLLSSSANTMHSSATPSRSSSGKITQRVAAGLRWIPVRVGRPDRDPQAAVGIDRHLHRIDQLRETFLPKQTD